MGSVFLTGLADWCRAAGLTTHEVDGWKTRARGSGGYDPGYPWCIVWHHTASQTSPQNDVNWCVNGSADAPIANLLLDRLGEVWVMAAGASNHAGKGGPYTTSKGTVPLDGMNSRSVGIEACNSGTGEPWPQVQVDSYFTLSTMLTSRLDLVPTDAITHQHWAPDRKVDPATAAAVQGPWRPASVTSSGTWSLDDVLDECSRRSQPPPQEDDVEIVELSAGTDAVFLGMLTKVKGLDAILWAEWVNGNEPEQLERLQAYRSMGIRRYDLGSTANMSGVGLIGPIPTGDKKHNWSRADFGNVL